MSKQPRDRIVVLTILAATVGVAGLGLWSVSRSDSTIAFAGQAVPTTSTVPASPITTGPPQEFTSVTDGMASQCQPDSSTTSIGANDDIPLTTLPPCAPVEELPPCPSTTLDPNDDQVLTAAPQTTLAPWVCDSGNPVAPPPVPLPELLCSDNTPPGESDVPVTTLPSCDDVRSAQNADYCQAVTGLAMVGSTDVADTTERYRQLLSLVVTLAPSDHVELWELMTEVEVQDFTYENFNPAADTLDRIAPDLDALCPGLPSLVINDSGRLSTY